jgi:hypothetical protein
MAKIEIFRWYETDAIDDVSDPQANSVTSRVKLRTDVRLSWTKIRSLRPMPRAGEEHPMEPGFFYKKATPKQLHKRVWEVELEYVPFQLEEEDKNPLNRKPKISYDSSSIEIPADRDNRGRMVVNTAAEPLLGIMRQIPTIDYTINVNLAKDPAFLQTHLMAVNRDTVVLRGLPWKPKTLLFASVSAGEFQKENKVSFSPFTLKIMANPLTWTQEVFNTGTLQLEEYELQRNGRTLKRYRQVPILEGSPAEPVSEAKALDERGRYVDDALQPSRTEPVKKTKLITLKFDIQPEVPFNNVLPLK